MSALSTHFDSTEFGLATATPDVVKAIRYGVGSVLQPIRDAAGPIEITSGYRPDDADSQHSRGEAADIKALDISQTELWAVIRDLALSDASLPVDQAIIYEEVGDDHIHISWTQRRSPRLEFRVKPAKSRQRLFPISYPMWHSYHGPLKPGAPSITARRAVPATAPTGGHMRTVQRVPQRAADKFLTDTKLVGVAAMRHLLEEMDRGGLTLDEAKDHVEDVASGLIDAGATLADALIEPGTELGERATDMAINAVASALSAAAAPFLNRAVAAVDDAISYSPRRASQRLLTILEMDLEDGVVGNDKARRVYRLARRICLRTPSLGQELSLSWEGDQLLIDGKPWGSPYPGFVGA